MEEMTTQTEEMENPTEQEQETPIENPIQEQTPEEQQSNSDSVVIESLPDNSENIIHELFSELGVNLDYTPVNHFQCFTMSLQFIAALWFIWWFVKYLWGLMRSFLSSRW